MKITKRDLKVILLLIGILSAFLAYQMYFSGKLEEIDQEHTKQEQLEREIAELEEKKQYEPTYRRQMQEWADDFAAKLEEFPVDQWYEDGILYLVELENECGVYFDSYTVLEATAVNTVTGNINYQPHAAQLLSAQTNATYSTTYESVKELINYVYADEEVTRVINSISMKFNRETGELSGNLVMVAYAMVGGTDRYYEAPQIPGYEELYDENYVPETDPDTGESLGKIGVDNIFGDIIETESETESGEGWY